jgi:ribosomal protein L16 Arg81 hydroxylase
VSLDGGCMTFSIGFRAPSQRDLATAAAAAYALLTSSLFPRGAW